MAKKTKYHERVGRKIQEIREKCGETILGRSGLSGDRSLLRVEGLKLKVFSLGTSAGHVAQGFTRGEGIPS